MSKPLERVLPVALAHSVFSPESEAMFTARLPCWSPRFRLTQTTVVFIQLTDLQRRQHTVSSGVTAICYASSGLREFSASQLKASDGREHFHTDPARPTLITRSKSKQDTLFLPALSYRQIGTLKAYSFTDGIWAFCHKLGLAPAFLYITKVWYGVARLHVLTLWIHGVSGEYERTFFTGN